MQMWLLLPPFCSAWTCMSSQCNLNPDSRSAQQAACASGRQTDCGRFCLSSFPTSTTFPSCIGNTALCCLSTYLSAACCQCPFPKRVCVCVVGLSCEPSLGT